jgi:hypothetical protein
MKGIVFNLLAQVVQREHGDDAWDALLDSASASGVYTSLGTYPDEEVARLVHAASALLGEPPQAILRWFGRKAMPLLAERFPTFFAPHARTRDFVLTLNDIVHPEVRKLYPGAVCPVFDFADDQEDVLRMCYHSHRKLCALAHGFIEGAADHYGDTVVVEEPSCMHRGDKACLLVMRFAKAA